MKRLFTVILTVMLICTSTLTFNTVKAEEEEIISEEESTEIIEETDEGSLEEETLEETEEPASDPEPEETIIEDEEIELNTTGTVTETGSCGTNATYTVYSDNSMVISGSGAIQNYTSSTHICTSYATVTSLTISSGITSIGNYTFNNFSALTSVDIPSTVVSIGRDAFKKCQSLSILFLPSTVTTISYSLFSNDYNLTVFTDASSKPSGWCSEWNGSAGFAYGCPSISAMNSSVQYWTSLNKNQQSITIPSTVYHIPSEAFKDNQVLEEIILPSSISSIPYKAFYNCQNLESTTMTNSVTYIGQSAFADCNSLETITLSNTLIKIDIYAFKNCSSLVITDLPDTINLIGNYAFSNCDSIVSIDLPLSLSNFLGSSFEGCGSLTSVTIPSGNTKYNSGGNCNAIIETLTNKLVLGSGGTVIPNTVVSIENNAFAGRTCLTSINIPASVTSIGVYAFLDCDNLTTITVDANNTTFDSRNNCNGIIRKSDNTLVVGCKNTVIPSTVTSIAGSAFTSVVDMKSFFIPSTVTSIDTTSFKPFAGFTKMTIYTDAASKPSGWPDDWNYVAFYTYAMVVYGVSSSDAEQAINFWSSLDNTATSVTIPDYIQAIPAYAFEEFTNLESVIIPDGVETIGASAFKGCTALEEVVLPNSVTTIGDNAFNGCTSLEFIEIPNSVTSIGAKAFYQCTSLEEIYLPLNITMNFTGTSNSPLYGSGSSLTVYVDTDKDITSWPSGWNSNATVARYDACPDGLSFTYSSDDSYVVSGSNSTESEITVPATYKGKSVTKISNEAFKNNTTLTEITVPTSITEIGTDAFDGAGNLETIIYQGTKDEWDNLTFSDKAIVMEDVNVQFSNGVYDHESGLTAYQNSDKDIIIYGDSEFLAAVAQGYVCDYVTNTYTQNGSIYFNYAEDSDNNSFGLCNYVYIDHDGTRYNTEYGLSEDGTSIIIPFKYFCLRFIESDDCRLSLCGRSDDDDLIFRYLSFYIQGVEEITNQPTITVMGNGDLKIRSTDTAYLNALIHTYNMNDCYPRSYGTFTIASIGCDYVMDFNRILDWNSFTDQFVLGSDEEGSYVLYSNEAQQNPFIGVIVNGNRSVVLGAYGYELSDPITVNFTQNMIVAPDDVSFVYNSSDYTFRITSSNTAWLEQISSLYFKNATTNSTKRFYLSNNCNISGTTRIIPLLGMEIADGTYSIEAFCGGYSCFATSNSTSTECNKLLSNNVTIQIDSFWSSLDDTTTSVTIPDSIQAIPAYAFERFSNLESVIIPNGVETIGICAFKGCTSLEEIVLPNSVTTIGDNAFNGCTSLEFVEIPNSVTSIGAKAFYQCTSLEEIYLPLNITMNFTESADSPFYGSDDSLTIYVDTNKDITSWPSGWNSNATVIRYDAYADGLVFTYSSDDSYVVSGSNGTESEIEVPATYKGKSVTKISAEAFKNNTTLTEITISTSITEIGVDAFDGAGNLETIIYQGTKDEWDGLTFNDKSDVMEDVDVQFSNGVYDHESGLSICQNSNKDILIYGDSEFLAGVAARRIQDYSGESTTDGGSIFFSNEDGYIGFSNYTNIYSDRTDTATWYTLSDDGTFITIPYVSLCIQSLAEDDYGITLTSYINENQESHEYVACHIQGVAEITVQPTITVMENGDLKIRSNDEAYLNALVHTYNMNGCSPQNRGTFNVVSGDYTKAYDFNCIFNGNSLTDKFVLGSDEEGSYVLYSNEAQQNPMFGTFVNGSRSVVLGAYGYELSNPITVNFTHNLIAAPEDVSFVYDSSDYTLRITSSNTAWLEQIQSIYFKNASTDSIQSFGSGSCNIVGNTRIISLIGMNIEDGTYYIEAHCGGLSVLSVGSVNASECNKYLGGNTSISGVPSIKPFIQGNIYFDSRGLVVHKENDDAFLNNLIAVSDGSMTDAEIIAYANQNSYSLLSTGFIVLEYNSNGCDKTVVIRNTTGNTILHKDGNEVYITYADLENLGLEIFINCYVYNIKVGSFAYCIANTQQYSAYGSALSDAPSDFNINEDEEGNIILTGQNSAFMNSIEYVRIYDESYYAIAYADDLDITSGRAVFDSDDIELDSGNYNVEIAAYGYKAYQRENALTVRHHTLKDAPVYTAEIVDGDLVITSTDTDWIDGLCDANNPHQAVRLSMNIKEKGTNPYQGIISFNDFYVYEGLVKRDNNTLVFTAESQKKSTDNIYLVNGTYDIQLRSEGYRLSEIKSVEFTSAHNNVPNDFEVETNNGHIYISTEDTDYLNAISTGQNTWIGWGTLENFETIIDFQSIYWPTHNYDMPHGSPGYGPCIYGVATKDIENNRIDIDLSDRTDIDLTDGKIYWVILYADGYLNAFVPVNTEIHTVTYHNDLGYTEGRKDYRFYYPEGLYPAFTETLNALSIEGYTFGGWYTDATYKKKVTSINYSTATEDIDLYAKLTPIKYTIKYKLNGGSKSYSKTSYYVTDDFDLVVPTRTGYTFGGWYTTKTFEEGTLVERIDEGSTGNLVLYAKWTPITYWVSFAGGEDGEGSMADMEIAYDESVELTANTYIRPGFTFTGWKGDNRKSYSNMAKVKNLSSSQDAEIVLTAQWKEVKNYTIKYNYNGGKLVKGSSATTKYNYPLLSDVTLPVLTRTGYTFGGWYTSANLNEESRIEIIEAGSYQDYILYAKWSPDVKEVTFVVSGETYATDTFEFSDNKKDVYTLTPLVRTGYTFKWYSDAKCTKAITSFTRNTTKDVTVYGKYTVNTYKITYKLGKGEKNGSKNPTSYKYSEEDVVYLNNPTKKGYIFLSWYVIDENGDISYLNYDEESQKYYIECSAATNVTLYTDFECEEYTITYIDDSESELDNPGTYTCITPTIKLKSPSKSGYTFTGWYNTSNNKKVTSINKGSMGSLTLEARYKANVNIIVFDKNGATSGSMKNMKLTYDVPATLTKNTFKKTGYVFGGWKTTIDGVECYFNDQVTLYCPSDVNNAKFTFTAVWIPIEYTLNFVLEPDVSENACLEEESELYLAWNTETSSYQKTLAYDEQMKLSTSMFDKTGSTITGWYYYSDAGKKVTLKSNVSIQKLTAVEGKVVDLYPIWTNNAYSVIYDGNGGTGTMSVTVAKNGATFNLASNSFKKTGYIFTGWKIEGEDTVYTNKQKITTALTDDSSVVLVAQWTPIHYTIIFNSNGGTGTVASVTLNYEEEYSVTDVSLSKNGKVFVGWATKRSAKEPNYAIGEGILNLTSSNNKRITLYAVYR